MNQRLKISDATKEKILSRARILVGLLFLYSGYQKLVAPNEYFQIAINMYQIAPDFLVPVVGHVVPFIELIFGLFLLVGYREQLSAKVLCGLGFVFQLVLLSALLRRLRVDECGCFGGGAVHLTLYQSFVLDSVLVIILIFVASAKPLPLSIDRRFLAPSEPPTAA